jgi:hypothetical protein
MPLANHTQAALEAPVEAPVELEYPKLVQIDLESMAETLSWATLDLMDLDSETVDEDVIYDLQHSLYKDYIQMILAQAVYNPADTLPEVLAEVPEHTATTTVHPFLKLHSLETDEERTITRYECNVRAKLQGNSIWECVLSPEDDIRIKQIAIIHRLEDGDSREWDYVYVAYTVNGQSTSEALMDSWTIYTDSGFEQTVSTLVGYKVSFTEQGMQANGEAMLAASW